MEVFTRIFDEEPTHFTKTDVKKKISWHIFKRVFPELLKLGLIVQILKIGNIEVYNVNREEGRRKHIRAGRIYNY